MRLNALPEPAELVVGSGARTSSRPSATASAVSARFVHRRREPRADAARQVPDQDAGTDDAERDQDHELPQSVNRPASGSRRSSSTVTSPLDPVAQASRRVDRDVPVHDRAARGHHHAGGVADVVARPARAPAALRLAARRRARSSRPAAGARPPARRASGILTNATSTSWTTTNTTTSATAMATATRAWMERGRSRSRRRPPVTPAPAPAGSRPRARRRSRCPRPSLRRRLATWTSTVLPPTADW